MCLCTELLTETARNAGRAPFPIQYFTDILFYMNKLILKTGRVVFSRTHKARYKTTWILFSFVCTSSINYISSSSSSSSSDHQIRCSWVSSPHKSIHLRSLASLFSSFLNPSKIATNYKESIHLSITQIPFFIH